MLNKTPMPEQKPELRITNFKEVAEGYTAEDAAAEANRCIGCKTRPCVNGCPVNVNIPEFIGEIKKGNIEEAYKIIKGTNSLPAVCGRVCPQETQCEQFCVRGKKGESVAIGRLERYCADYCMGKDELSPEIKLNGKKAAIIGAGPAGLTCAGDLAKAGFDVTIFEAFHTEGGVLTYGIPEFRLPKSIVKQEVEALKKLGVKIELDMVIGKVLTVEELLGEQGFDAVFIGTGAGLPSFMGIPGENLNGVYSANEFLTRINLMKAYDFPNTDTPVYIKDNVIVVGGGNVAMDAARCAKRMGAKNVTIVYRRSEAEMPARAEEVHHAKEEGINFMLLTNPVRVIGDDKGYATEMECVRMTLGEPDEKGRRRPVVEQGSEFNIPAEVVIIAIGQSPNPLIKNTTPEIETTKWGGIVTDEATARTSMPKVYAGGDAVTGAATVIAAMGMGKIAAKSIIEDNQ